MATASLPVRSSAPQSDVSGNPFAVRVHPDACMEMGRQPDGAIRASPRGVTLSPSQRGIADSPEGHRIDNCHRIPPRVYSGAPAAARGMYAGYVEPACAPSNSPVPAQQLRSAAYDMQVYSEPARRNPGRAVGLELDAYSQDCHARKNISASHASTATGLGMFPVSEIGTVPLRPQSATPSVYSHPMHAAQRAASGSLGAMGPPNHISAQRRARSMVLQGSIDEHLVASDDQAVQRSHTLPRGDPRTSSVASDLIEDQEDAPGCFPGFSADTTTSVMSQLSGLLTNPGPAGLPPGVIAGAHMHRREARTYAGNGNNSNMHVPTSGSDGCSAIAFSNRGDVMSPLVQATVHSGARPVTDSAVLAAGGASGAMHASMPARPFTDSACAAGRRADFPHLSGRMTDGGVIDERGLEGQRAASWDGTMDAAGSRMCFSNSGSANRVGTHSTQHAMIADAAARAGASPVQRSMLAEPLETLRLTQDMMYSGSFPGHMGRVAGVQQQLQQFQQQQQQHQQESEAAALSAALKQVSQAMPQEHTESYAHTNAHAHGSPVQRPPAVSSGIQQWGSHAHNTQGVTMNGGQFPQGDPVAFSAGPTHTHSDVSNPHSGLMRPMSVDRMSEGESDYDDDQDLDQDGYSPQTQTLSRDGKDVTTHRGSVQDITTPDKPNPALLREWSGYGRPSDSGPMSARELLAAGVKSTDSACEASGEPSGAMGGVVVKQEDSATGEGTCGAVYSSHKHGGSMGEADKPPRRKRATGLTSEERRERRRKSNRESARRSRVRKLEETHESETAIATLQNRINAQAKMLSVATEHLESMKACLSHQETQISQLLGTICVEAQVGNVTSPVAKQAAVLQKTLIHETSMASQTHISAQQ